MKIIFKAVNNNNEDGRGRDDPPMYFTSKEDAEEATKGKSNYNQDGSIDEIILFESYEESTATAKKKLREQALAKLSLPERRALGILLP